MPTGVFIRSKETCEKIRHAKLGEKNPMYGKFGSQNPTWKDNPSYNTLHKWLKMHLPKPNLCERCNLIPPKDMCNITGVYNRDFSNWKYMCRKCHLVFDDNIKNLKPPKKIDFSDYRCSICGSDKTYIQKKNGRPHWLYRDDKPVCGKCNQRIVKSNRRTHINHIPMD